MGVWWEAAGSASGWSDGGKDRQGRRPRGDRNKEATLFSLCQPNPGSPSTCVCVCVWWRTSNGCTVLGFGRGCWPTRAGRCLPARLNAPSMRPSPGCDADMGNDSFSRNSAPTTYDSYNPSVKFTRIPTPTTHHFSLQKLDPDREPPCARTAPWARKGLRPSLGPSRLRNAYKDIFGSSTMT